MSPTLRIVIPAFNEQDRLPRTLRAVRRYIDCVHDVAAEMIVVDDGSSDDTVTVCRRLQSEGRELKLFRHGRNLGKGAAIQTGVTKAGGDLILVTDADLSVPITYERRLREAIMDGADIAVGSRLLPDSDSRRTVARRVFGLGFAWLAARMFELPVRDTQCGFKMYSSMAAQRVWPLVKEAGYLADIETLVRAKQLGLCVVEVPISYRDVPGSKMSVWRDAWNMWVSLWRLRGRLERELIHRKEKALERLTP